LFIAAGVPQEDGSIKIYIPQKCGMFIMKFLLFTLST